MGLDITQIGLNHNLPVDDPFETAKEVAKRMNRNIKLGYIKMYEYDVDNNIVNYSNDESRFVDIEVLNIDSSNEYLTMIIHEYQAHQILNTVGIDNIRIAATKNCTGEMLLDDIEGPPYALYEVIGESEDLLIYKENIHLRLESARWFWLENTFHSNDAQGVKWLRDYRMRIYNHAQMFGCSEVIICADQCSGAFILDNLHFSSNSLKEYISTCQYLKDYKSCNAELDIDEWEKHAKHVSFASFFKNEISLEEDDFIDVVFDDFSDITGSHEGMASI